jgi:drug/metabolite transporter (DMT)-like permease
MTMLWMLLAALFMAAFGHVMRFGQTRGMSMPWIGAVNYLFGAFCCWLWWLAEGRANLRWEACLFGGLTGACFVAAYFLMVPCLRSAGVGITQSVGRLSVVLPVAASVLLWREVPTLVQGGGLLLALVALPLLAQHNAAPGAPRGERWKLVLVLFFLTQGVAGLAMKAYKERVPAGGEAAFLACLFTVAALGNLLALLDEDAPRARDIFAGAALGAVNVLANYTFMHALWLLPGAVVFPVTSVGSIVLSAGAAVILWGERYRGLTLLGLALAGIALVMLNT